MEPPFPNASQTTPHSYALSTTPSPGYNFLAILPANVILVEFVEGSRPSQVRSLPTRSTIAGIALRDPLLNERPVGGEPPH